MRQTYILVPADSPGLLMTVRWEGAYFLQGPNKHIKACREAMMRLQKPMVPAAGLGSRPGTSRCIPSCLQGGPATSSQQPARPVSQRSVKTQFAPDKVPEVVTPTGVRSLAVTFNQETHWADCVAAASNNSVVDCLYQLQAISIQLSAYLSA